MTTEAPAALEETALAHEYVRRIILAQAQLPGELLSVQVFHDHGCGVYSGKPCQCNCDVIVTRPSDGRKFSVNADGSLEGAT